MNARRAALALGINERTLKLWIQQPDLAPYFSPTARLEGSQRDLNDDDFLTANTIRVMRQGVPNNAPNWSGMAARLAEGHRERTLPPSAATVETGLTVMAQHERMVTVTTERDAALRQIDDLRAQLATRAAKLEAAYREHRGDVERLMRAHGELRDTLARAEMELELYRKGRLKPE